MDNKLRVRTNFGLVGVLRCQIFTQLAVEDLLRCMSVCKAWRLTSSSEALWEVICRRRWRLWSATPTRYEGIPGQLRWRGVCRYRMETDRSARGFVAAMEWPLKRPSCLRRLVSLGDLVVEVRNCGSSIRKKPLCYFADVQSELRSMLIAV